MRFEYATRWVRGNWHKEEQKKGLVGKETVQDARYVDIDDLSTRIVNACVELGNDGYEVISVMPIVRGYWDRVSYTAAGHAISKEQTAFGFSVTDGAIITAKRVPA
jgi:hypothetical protein